MYVATTFEIVLAAFYKRSKNGIQMELWCERKISLMITDFMQITATVATIVIM